MKQQVWFNLHHWAGFHFSLLLTAILLTGTFATISSDLDWLTNSAVRADKMLGNEQVLDWTALLKAVQTRFPETQIDSINRPTIPWHNVEVIARDINNKRFRIYIDANRYEVTGQGRWLNWQRFFRQVHRHFMLPVKIGVTVVGLFAVVLLFLMVTALYTYRHWWRYFFSFTRIKRVPQTIATLKPQKVAAHKRRFWSEIHKIVGLWSIWFLIIISLTGIWYLIEQWGGAAKYAENASSAYIGSQNKTRFFSDLALSKALKRIKEQHPEYVINEVSFDTKKGVIEIEGQDSAWLVRNRANKQVFDQYTGGFIEGRKGEMLNWHFRISEAADPLHFGTFSGWIFRYIWFVFGIALSSLSITGVYLYLLRLKQSGVIKQEGNLVYVTTIWKRCHWFKWLSVVLLGVCVYLVIITFILA